jgi:hypothetical protein
LLVLRQEIAVEQAMMIWAESDNVIRVNGAAIPHWNYVRVIEAPIKTANYTTSSVKIAMMFSDPAKSRPRRAETAPSCTTPGRTEDVFSPLFSETRRPARDFFPTKFALPNGFAPHRRMFACARTIDVAVSSSMRSATDNAATVIAGSHYRFCAKVNACGAAYSGFPRRSPLFCAIRIGLIGNALLEDYAAVVRACFGLALEKIAAHGARFCRIAAFPFWVGRTSGINAVRTDALLPLRARERRTGPGTMLASTPENAGEVTVKALAASRASAFDQFFGYRLVSHFASMRRCRSGPGAAGNGARTRILPERGQRIKKAAHRWAAPSLSSDTLRSALIADPARFPPGAPTARIAGRA